MPADKVSRLAVLISGRGSNLRSIHAAIEAERLNAEIVALYSNVVGAAGIDFARNHGIPVRLLAHTDYTDRDAFELALHNALLADKPDIIALAGFMRILSANFVAHWQGRLLNIHPSLLPRHPGLDTHARAIAAGDTEAGASVHYVTPPLDGGPVIVQAAVDIDPDDNAVTLRDKVLNILPLNGPHAAESSCATATVFSIRGYMRPPYAGGQVHLIPHRDAHHTNRLSQCGLNVIF